METKFFKFDQNNPGGRYDHDKFLTLRVIVEALCVEQAERIAEDKGIYYNGVNIGFDCPCCGDRWYRPDKYDEIKLDGQTIEEYAADWEFFEREFKDKGIPHTRILFLDGSVKEYFFE